MVAAPFFSILGRAHLSVLALSSRFDGRRSIVANGQLATILSVLALSSRFDGRR